MFHHWACMPETMLQQYEGLQLGSIVCVADQFNINTLQQLSVKGKHAGCYHCTCTSNV